MKNIDEYLGLAYVLSELTAENYAETMARLITMIQSTPNPALSLNEANLSDLQCQCLAELMSKTPNLTCIGLYRCMITTFGFSTLISAIALHQGITRLNMDDLNIYIYHPDQDNKNPFNYRERDYENLGDKEAEIIAKMLTQNNFIQNLSLAENNITDLGGRQLLNAILNQTKIWQFKLSGSKISAEIKSSIKRVLERNRNNIIALNRSLEPIRLIEAPVVSDANSTEVQGEGPFDVGTIERIMFFSDPFTLKRCAQVSKSWKVSVNLNWRHRLAMEYPEVMQMNNVTFNTNYFKIYLQQRRLTASAIVSTLDDRDVSMKDKAGFCVSELVMNNVERLMEQPISNEEVATMLNKIENCLLVVDKREMSNEEIFGSEPVTLFYFLTKLARLIAYESDKGMREYLSWLPLMNKVLFCIELVLNLGANMDFVSKKGHTVFRHVLAAKPVLQKEMYKLFRLYYDKFNSKKYLQACFQHNYWRERDIILFMQEIDLSSKECLELIIPLENSKLMKTFLDSNVGRRLLQDNELLYEALSLTFSTQHKSRSPLANISAILLLESIQHLRIPLEDLAKLELSAPMQALLSHYLVVDQDINPDDNVEQSLIECIERGKVKLASALIKGGAKILSHPSNPSITMTEYALTCRQFDIARLLASHSLCMLLNQPYTENFSKSLLTHTVDVLMEVLPEKFQLFTLVCNLGITHFHPSFYADEVSAVGRYNLQESSYRKLIGTDYDIHQIYPNKLNLMQSACYHSNVRLVKLLLELGVSAQMKTREKTLQNELPEGTSLLFLVLVGNPSKSESLQVLQMLIAAGADPAETIVLKGRDISLLDIAKSEYSQSHALIAFLEKCATKKALADSEEKGSGSQLNL